MKRYMNFAAVGVLVLIFGGAGLAKISVGASFADQFAHFGLPAWWIYLTGAVELTGAALIAIPKHVTRRFGAALLAATMAVATMLHLLNDPAAMALPAFSLMLLAGFVAWKPQAAAAPQALAQV
jgi:hypothetical protein